MIVDGRIEAHLAGLQRHGDPVLEQMEGTARERGFPIVGPLVGRLLGVLAGSVRARSVFEVGSGFGYSTAYFARAVGAGGRVVHTDGDAGLSREARQWLGRMEVLERVEFVVGDALQALHDEEGPFDVVFIDADKHQYPRAWDLARNRVRVGGLVITDNALWQGRVADPAWDDEDTAGVREYLERSHGDPDFLTTVVPLRDGVAVSLRQR